MFTQDPIIIDLIIDPRHSMFYLSDTIYSDSAALWIYGAAKN